jgi:hypothetical protein
VLVERSGLVSTLWLPGAERVPGRHAAGGSLTGGPPRCTHHITWDALGPHGERPSFDGVRDYLVSMGFEPTLMVDPILGRVAQFLPANRSAYAIRNLAGGVETNRDGDTHIQVEWFFSPGCVVNGKRYDDLTDTPMRGLDEVLALCAEYDIPPVWAVGQPTWRSSPRSTDVWLSTAGHYGHSQVPENDHTDPGPLRLSAVVAHDTAPPTPIKEDYVATLDPADKADLIQQITGGVRPADHHDTNPRVISNADILTAIEALPAKIAAALKAAQ